VIQHVVVNRSLGMALSYGSISRLLCPELYGTAKPAATELLFSNGVRIGADSAHRGGFMLWTLFVILLVLWLLGLITSYTFGGFIHILLVVAIAVILIQLITGRRAV
jgi:Family of unknown function (DUF5670)